MDSLLLQSSKGAITPPFRQKISHGLIDATASIIESIWPSHSFSKSITLTPLKPFLVQTLRESKVSIITLQIALLYLLRVKIAGKYEGGCKGGPPNFAKCGRRMFIAALIVSGKFLNDKYLKNCTWAQLTKTPVAEINMVELSFLRLIDYNLFVPVSAFVRWSTLLSNYICTKESCPPLTSSCVELFGHLSKPNRKQARYAPYAAHRRSTHSKATSASNSSNTNEHLRLDGVPLMSIAKPLDDTLPWSRTEILNLEPPNKPPSDLFHSLPISPLSSSGTLEPSILALSPLQQRDA
ncbi:hypothetical protein K493DRAFT_296087 [Basidiobolus meristosporus CBS 931.73]|uniref:Cyclin N-terminal domain-containing protein n=1 Tax=Basidiobolus meristosporus CBS 931.73 TaxID=1314790 RepID=A0A1Y1Z7W1_9FUNG|nr:hypothetical protein K493DRAFT_296087 [Basidiobolus meristosporus CBS 931.73]|eukprot:ORY06341.1 hypothetical protein K493DRAFT_296087 [Basidiobolus meristosporus CBS 931.73]